METIEKFIQLRAEGKSFDKIVKLIKVSKPTLIAWEMKYKGAIDALKWSRFENILEKYKLTQEDRIARLAKELSLVWETYEQKDYENLSKRELLSMIIRLEHSLKEETAALNLAIKNYQEKEPEEGELNIQVNVVESKDDPGKLIKEIKIPFKIDENGKWEHDESRPRIETNYE
ncbi:MAG: hypothetical protein ACYCVH_16145 [Ignavibacteriaceae bacterium]